MCTYTFSVFLYYFIPLHTLCTDDLMSRQTNPRAVFTNSELSLKQTDVYGFDFDYTLVHYTSEVHRLIYELARDRLVEHNDVSMREGEREKWGRWREKTGAIYMVCACAQPRDVMLDMLLVIRICIRMLGWLYTCA